MASAAGLQPGAALGTAAVPHHRPPKADIIALRQRLNNADQKHLVKKKWSEQTSKWKVEKLRGLGLVHGSGNSFVKEDLANAYKKKLRIRDLRDELSHHPDWKEPDEDFVLGQPVEQMRGSAWLEVGSLCDQTATSPTLRGPAPATARARARLLRLASVSTSPRALCALVVACCSEDSNLDF